MIRAGALLLTILTGFTGLVYQVTWQKYLATLLGSQSEATAAVLGIFLGGLSVGYSLFGGVTRKLVARGERLATSPRLLLSYGAIEASIGIYALVFPWLFRAAQGISFALPHSNAGVGFFFDVVLAALLIGSPAVLMGATIPILTQALSRSLEDATRFHAFVYGLNTIGAFAGALAAGFYVIPRLGLDGTLYAMGAINLFAGLVFALLGTTERSPVDVESKASGASAAAEDVEVDVAASWIYLTVALLIGFAMMTLETTLIRLGALAFGSSHFTFSMVVAAFVLCIAIGGLSVSGLSRIPRAFLAINLWLLVVLLVGLYFVLPQAPYWVYVIRTAFEDRDIAFYLYYLAGFGLLLLVMGFPIFLSGITLPLIFHHLRDEVGELGALAGKLYSWNTVGSLLGALVGGYALFFWFDLHEIYRFAVAALIIAAVLITVRLYSMRNVMIAAVVPLLILLAGMPPWYSMMLQIGLYRDESPPPDLYDGYENYVKKYVVPTEKILISYEDDPTASVAVRNYGPTGRGNSRSIIVNGKPDGNTLADYRTMGFASILPALMADSFERTFIIGLGTGVTVGEIAALEGSREVVVSEISPGVIRAARYFDPYNQYAISQPSVSVVRSDAYRALTRSSEKFNLIISEPPNPWVTGVEMLYSQEFLTLARARLADGGVYAQWIHKYEIDDESIAIVLRTFSSVFEHISVWEAGPMDLIILGFPDIGPTLDYHRMIERSQRPDFKAGLARVGVYGVAGLMAKEFLPAGVWHAAEFEGSVHTLYKPILSDTAGRAFFRRDSAKMPFTGFARASKIGNKNALLKKYTDFRGGVLGDDERLLAVHQATSQSRGYGVTLVADWLGESPDSPAFEQSYDLAIDWLQRTESESFEPEVLIESLSTLFRGSNKKPGQHTPESARKLTERYIEFYYHAAPFDPDRLTNVWSNCRERTKSRDQCEQEFSQRSKDSFDFAADKREASEAYVVGCLAQTFEGPLCREGRDEAFKLLEGQPSRFDRLGEMR